jgi:hypothetical protein
MIRSWHNLASPYNARWQPYSPNLVEKLFRKASYANQAPYLQATHRHVDERLTCGTQSLVVNLSSRPS